MKSSRARSDSNWDPWTPEWQWFHTGENRAELKHKGVLKAYVQWTYQSLYGEYGAWEFGDTFPDDTARKFHVSPCLYDAICHAERLAGVRGAACRPKASYKEVRQRTAVLAVPDFPDMRPKA